MQGVQGILSHYVRSITCVVWIAGGHSIWGTPFFERPLFSYFKSRHRKINRLVPEQRLGPRNTDGAGPLSDERHRDRYYRGHEITPADYLIHTSHLFGIDSIRNCQCLTGIRSITRTVRSSLA